MITIEQRPERGEKQRSCINHLKSGLWYEKNVCCSSKATSKNKQNPKKPIIIIIKLLNPKEEKGNKGQANRKQVARL